MEEDEGMWNVCRMVCGGAFGLAYGDVEQGFCCSETVIIPLRVGGCVHIRSTFLIQLTVYEIGFNGLWAA